MKLLALAAVVAAHEIHIPQTEYYVSSILSEYAGYVSYTAPATATGFARVAATDLPKVDASCSFWMEQIPHRGVAAFNDNKNYAVFRNVKDYGAKGDGVTDDTRAINSAVSSGGRFGPDARDTSTNTPAVVYFPPGTYVISSPIVDYYYTQIIGNPNCLPVIKGAPNFSGLGLIDGQQYNASGKLPWGATNTFWRQVRNLVLDTRSIPAQAKVTGVHWPTGQATSLQNLVIRMSEASNTAHEGVFIEEGSGGFAADLVISGGVFGMNQGNQQFTMRNITIRNSINGVRQLWDWGWTYKGLNINNCSVGIDLSAGGRTAQAVAGVVIVDSVFTNTPRAILTARDATAQPEGSGALVLENVRFTNVNIAVQRVNLSMGTTLLAGSSGTTTVAAWAQGHQYKPRGPIDLQGTNIPANNRPASLLAADGSWYQRSKPQYNNLPASSFVSVRQQGAIGDGVADDTAAVQKALNTAVAAGKVCFFDAGTYRVTNTVTIPPGSKVVGESYSVIMSSGRVFNSVRNPVAVVKVGNAGQTGTVEWSDMIVSTRGAQAGAILIQWNLATSGQPSGMWDVHTRIGGFVGSNLTGDTCPTTPNTKITRNNYNKRCVAAFLNLHITKSATNLYLENVWIWTADHDIDTTPAQVGQRITVYTGRGLLCESTQGNIWLYGTSVEHNVLYEYQFVNTKNIFMGQIQTETAYYQPNPSARIPFASNATWFDPKFGTKPYNDSTNSVQVPNANGWGLRVVNSNNLFVYGAGFYSFFNNYSTQCSDLGSGASCQSRIVSIEQDSNVYIYDLHTVGTRIMLRDNNNDLIRWSDNEAGFSQEVAIYRPA